MQNSKSNPSDSSSPPRRIHRFGISLNVFIQLILFLVLFGIVNYLNYRHYIRRDLTPSRDYTLSEATQGYVRKLSKDVDLTLVFARQSDLMQDCRALVEEFRSVKKTRIKVEEVDPARDLERAEQLKLKYGITLSSNGILVRANNHTRFISEEELVIKGLNGDRDHPSVDFRGEDAVLSAVIGLIEEQVRKFYFITGKGTSTSKGNDLAFKSLAELGNQQNFEVLPLNFTEVESIPENASGVILVGALYDFGDREIAMLQNYWLGKRAAILLLLDPNGETPRLRQFLQSKGVTPRPDRVLLAESTSAGPKKQFSVDTVFLENSPITKPFTQVNASFSGQTQSLDLKTDAPELNAQQIEVLPIIDATKRFWGETRYLMDLPVVDPEDTKPPVHLAASVERGAVSDERLRVDSSRMVVVGNALLLDPETRLAVHQDFIASSLNWMMARERLIGPTPKRKQMFRIELTPQQRKQVFWVTAFLMPGLVLVFGFLMWSHRRA